MSCKVVKRKVICRECGKEYEAYPRLVEQGKTKYCSLKCLWATPHNWNYRPSLGSLRSVETKQKIRETLLGRISPMKGKLHTEETRGKMRVSAKQVWARGSLEWRDERIKHLIIAVQRKPNQKELKLAILLGQDWRFVGDGQFILGGRCPDFINTNGKKQVIELLGTYWHPLFDGANRIEHYKKYGFSCLVIWEDEVANLPRLTKKIKRFVDVR